LNLRTLRHHKCEHSRAEPAPDDRCGLQQGAVVGIQAVGPCGKQALHAQRQDVALHLRVKQNLAVLHPYGALIEKKAQNSCPEQRITNRALGDLLSQVGGQVLHPQTVLCEMANVIGPKRRQRKWLHESLRAPAWCVFGRPYVDDEQIQLPIVFDQLGQQFLGGAVDPMNVFNPQHDQACRALRFDHRGKQIAGAQPDRHTVRRSQRARWWIKAQRVEQKAQVLIGIEPGAAPTTVGSAPAPCTDAMTAAPELIPLRITGR